jgi:hypothetical protein
MANNSTTTNTLPARVNGGGSINGGGMVNGPIGRHFKPFDHRRMNPMAEIAEDPYNHTNGGGSMIMENPYGTSGEQICVPGRPPVVPNNTNLIVHKNTQFPHMPSEVRHTNYSQQQQQQQQQQPQQQQQQQQQQQRKPQLVNPAILDHRDSANFSMASSDSG